MVETILNLPLWGMIRSLGIVSYVLMFAGMCFGILYSFPGWSGPTKLRLYWFHTYGTNFGMLIGLLHGIITIIDTYMPFAWGEVLIPFAAKHDPFLNGLGTLAGYGMLILVFTSDIRNKLKRKVWHMIHLLSYPVFAMAFIHGYFLGTDTEQPAIRFMYVFSVTMLLGLTVVRALLRPRPKEAAVVGRTMR